MYVRGTPEQHSLHMVSTSDASIAKLAKLTSAYRSVVSVSRLLHVRSSDACMHS